MVHHPAHSAFWSTFSLGIKFANILALYIKISELDETIA